MRNNVTIDILSVIVALAGIFSALAYPQYIIPQETQYGVESRSMAINEASECESCHKDPQNITSHVKGGNFCLYCHGSKVHDYHKGTDNEIIDCIACHGFPPIVPQPKQSEKPEKIIVCNKCHAPPPDPFKPSNGNLIVIHQSRSTYCTNCHGAEIGEKHKGIMIN